MSVHSNFIIRGVRLLRFGDAAAEPSSSSAHPALHLRECTADPVWGAAATPASPSAYISPPSARVSIVWGAATAPSSLCVHTAPRARTSTPVWGAAATPSSPRRVHSSDSSSARQLRCGVPPQLQHHQARTSAPRARASTPVWGAAATPSSPNTHLAHPKVCG